jgi:hypothetical protein
VNEDPNDVIVTPGQEVSRLSAIPRRLLKSVEWSDRNRQGGVSIACIFIAEPGHPPVLLRWLDAIENRTDLREMPMTGCAPMPQVERRLF